MNYLSMVLEQTNLRAMSDGMGAFVRRVRGELEITQTELAQRVNVSKGYLSTLEADKIALPAPDIRRRLAAALNVRHIDLLVAAGELTEDEIDDVAPLVGNDPDVDLIAESWEFLDRKRRESILDQVRTFAESSPRYEANPAADREKAG